MDLLAVAELIGSAGFPAACVVGLAWFAWYMINKVDKMNNENMNRMQERCIDREEKLFQEIKENREINAKAIDTIAHYAEKLDTIQRDITDIKTDITIIMAKE